MTAALMEAHGLTRHFGGVTAVDGVDLVLESGRSYGLIGPNGAGKTTLVNLLTGALKPSSGRIMFDDKDITTLPPERRARLGIARTFQVPRPFREMTIGENALVGSLFGHGAKRTIAAARDDAARGLAFVGLASREEEDPAALSVGERKLLELARCLATTPRVIFLDEVTAGLNEGERREIREVVRRLLGDGLTLIVIEHIVDFIVDTCTDLVVLDGGRLLAQGPVQDVLKDERVVTAYLGRRRSRNGEKGNS